MRKIFTFKMICLLILGSFLIYKLFISFEIENFPNGRPTLDQYNIMVQMIEDYGNAMDEAELQHFKNIYKERLIEADKFLSNNKDFNEVGVYSYEDYKNANEKSFFDEKNQKFDDIMWKYLGKEDGNIFWELQEYHHLIDYYEERNDYGSVELDGEKYEKRINEIIKNKENESIFSGVVFNNYNDLIRYFGLCIVVGIIFMLTPLFLKDKSDKVLQQQYTTKQGRNLFKSKLIAGFLSALIIITIELIICFILYRGNNTTMFFESKISSVFNSSFWFDITFIQYIIITVISIYIIGILTAFISMFISSKANSYVAAIGMQVPALFVIGGLTVEVLLNKLFVLYIPKYLVLAIYLILVIFTVSIIIISIKKEKSIDIIY